MKNPLHQIDILFGERVNEEMIQEANRLENDPDAILRLIDFLFLGYDESKIIPS